MTTTMFARLFLCDLIHQLCIFSLFVNEVAHLRLSVELYEQITFLDPCSCGRQTNNGQCALLLARQHGREYGAGLHRLSRSLEA
jgi:hypothetical protein